MFTQSSRVIQSTTRKALIYKKKTYVIKFVNDLRQVGGFLRVLLFSPPKKKKKKKN